MCRYVKAADKEIIAAIKGMGRLVDNQTFTHSYPFCWRSETPLIYKVCFLSLFHSFSFFVPSYSIFAFLTFTYFCKK